MQVFCKLCGWSKAGISKAQAYDLARSKAARSAAVTYPSLEERLNPCTE